MEEAYSIDKLNIQGRVVPPNELAEWPHLTRIKVPELPGAEVTVLIGMELTDAHDVIEIKREVNQKNAPMAIHTPFGWCIVGQMRKRQKSNTLDVFATTQDEKVDFQTTVQKFITGEKLNTHPDVKVPIPPRD